MAHLALYRKYRPTSLDQVIGQPQVTDLLQAMAQSGEFAHSFLLVGQRGTGKTTVARILAHMINGLDYNDAVNDSNVDIIEIDAASNNSVEDIRDLRSGINLTPMQCPYKVYIIDEFHMLSKSAFNALLKTIEEPPEHVIFILATTEVQKIPATILSRVQRYNFHPVDLKLLTQHLAAIATAENISCDQAALQLIAEQGGGSVRDSITILDQLSNQTAKITVDTVERTLGLIPHQQLAKLLTATADNDAPTIITIVQTLADNGIAATNITNQLINYFAKQALKSPALYRIIRELLEVNQAGMPIAQLLAVLVCANLRTTTDPSVELPSPQPKAAATLAPKPQAAPATLTPKPQVAPAPQPKAKAKAPAQSNPEPKSIIKGDFPLVAVKAQLKAADELSALSLLDMCDFRYNTKTNTLTLFFGKAFHRRRANTNKFKTALTNAIAAECGAKPNIEISDDAAPAGSAASKIITLMGGGEVINDSQI